VSESGADVTLSFPQLDFIVRLGDRPKVSVVVTNHGDAAFETIYLGSLQGQLTDRKTGEPVPCPSRYFVNTPAHHLKLEPGESTTVKVWFATAAELWLTAGEYDIRVGAGAGVAVGARLLIVE
jgi:hypothetical protein